MCAWRSRMTRLASSSRRGLLRSPTGWTRRRSRGSAATASKIQNPNGVLAEVIERVTQGWAEKGTTLMALADGADLLLAGHNQQTLAANVAEYYGIPLAALHIFPTQLLDFGWLRLAHNEGG